MTNTEDIDAKMTACGFDVIDIEDGCYDIEGIVKALERARNSKDKPTFINIKTIIGLGSAVAGQAEAHGAAFGADDVKEMKRANGFNPDEYMIINDTVRDFFAHVPERGQGFVHEWKGLVDKYSKEHPELGQEFQSRVRGEIRSDWRELIPKSFTDEPTASRASSGLVFNPLAKEIKSFMVGTADLSPSVNMVWDGKEDFQHVSLTFHVSNRILFFTY